MFWTSNPHVTVRECIYDAKPVHRLIHPPFSHPQQRVNSATIRSPSSFMWLGISDATNGRKLSAVGGACVWMGGFAVAVGVRTDVRLSVCLSSLVYCTLHSPPSLPQYPHWSVSPANGKPFYITKNDTDRNILAKGSPYSETKVNSKLSPSSWGFIWEYNSTDSIQGEGMWSAL